MNWVSAAEFDAAIAGQSSVAVHFWASWAPQCVQMNEVLDELAKSYPYVKCIKVQAEEVPEISERYEITAVPTFVLLKAGVVSDRVNGANAPALTAKIEALSQSATTTIAAPPKPAALSQDELNAKLKKLVNAAPIMLFMKGTPAEPKCGFSKKIVKILNDQEAKFSSFDILTDDAVRQGLKAYSNWPTYPQLYVNGELLGGLDIVEAMVQSGELKDALPKPASKEELHARLRALIQQDPVMVFIKGTPETPRCGFTKQLLAILAEDGVKYGYYDILGDSEVREGLKEFSNWPTFPQLYVKGELVGGLDIVKELRVAGEFADVIRTA